MKKEKIRRIVLEVFSLTEVQLLKKTRKEEIAKARQIAMYFTRVHTKLSLEGIGSYYGKDHATVLYAFRAVKNIIETKDWKYIHHINTIESEINKIDNYINLCQL